MVGSIRENEQARDEWATNGDYSDGEGIQMKGGSDGEPIRMEFMWSGRKTKRTKH